MKLFNKPYFKVINLGATEEIDTCGFHCECNLVTCTCDEVCGCVDDCIIDTKPSA